MNIPAWSLNGVEPVPRLENSEFLDNWSSLAGPLVTNACEQPVTGKRKVRQRIKEITEGRCHFMASGADATVSFANWAVRMGRIRVGILRWTGNAACETSTWRAKDHHLSLQIPLRHSFEIKQADEWSTVAPGTGLIIAGAEEIHRRWVGASTLLNIMIDREALDQQAMLAASPLHTYGSLPRMAIIDLQQFPMLTQFLSLLLIELNTSTSLLKRPDVEYETNRLLIQLIIAASKAAYEGQPVRDRLAIVPGYIRIAERFIRDKYPHPISMRQVAEACQISVRTLQSGFRKYRDTTPKEFIRSVRLTQARSLLVSNPSLSIASIANLVGYRSHSQFTGDYKKTFGECPKTTRGAPPFASCDPPAVRQQMI